MNKRRLAVIAKWLEAGAPHKKGVVGFSMRHVRRPTACGTVCCIAGAANQFFGDKQQRLSNFSDDASELLEMNYEQSEALFCPDGYEGRRRFSPKWAARVIRKLIATGEVDWEGTRTSA